MKLNLGSGRRPQEGYVNVDSQPASRPDTLWNLEIVPWPWEDESVDEILASHILEHVGADSDTFCAIMVEMWRVLKVDAKVEIRIPHPRSDGYLGDPTHVRPLLPQSFQLFDKKANEFARANNWPNTPLGEYLGINFELAETHYNLTPQWAELLKRNEISQADLHKAIQSYNNVVDEIVLTLYKRE